MDTVLDPSPDSPAPRRALGALGWLLLLAVLAAGSYGAWQAWHLLTPIRQDGPDLSPEALDARLLEAEQTVTTLRRTQQNLDRKLTDTTARTGLLRDEVLGVGQRAAILEDSLHELSAQAGEGRQALRLDEAELLLSLAQARLGTAGDLDGAIRATALAREVLEPLTDPQFINLRQTLGQELAALRALPADPRAQVAGELDALEALLPRLASRAPGATTPADGRRPGWQRLVDAVVQVRPSRRQDLISPSDRSTGEAALGLDLALARTALDRRDQAAFRASLVRVDLWLQRLYADNATLRERRQRLAALGRVPLMHDMPLQGASLQQLRGLRRNGRSGP